MAGLTTQGFQAKQQSEIIEEIQNSLRTAFGTNINLLPESVFGQLIGIFSEREALLWQLAEAVYTSQYPAGAEGASVDNILALNNLTRLPASASRTAPDTETLYGLVVKGTPGTVVTAGSLISVVGQPTQQFAIDADVTIAAAVDAVQSLFFTQTPDAGSFVINIGLLQTAAISHTATATDVQNAIQALTGYGDVTVTGTYGTGFVITFAGSAGGQAQPLITISSNTLFDGATAVNINVVNTTPGAPAQAIASATATTNGPISVAAGSLTVIDTPISGWDTVNNELDVIPGRNEETDTEALQRRLTLLSSAANGPLPSIVAKVSQVADVTSAVGFENRTGAADQFLTISAEPTSGDWSLRINEVTTATLSFDATAGEVQTALRNIAGYEDVLVTGTMADGFNIEFNGAQGGQPQELIVVFSNTLSDGSPITITPSFARPPHSLEIVVEGGADQDIAQAIYDSKPAGIQTFGTTTVNIEDELQNVFPINFSRPDTVTPYVAISLTVDASVFPGDGIAQIQEDIITIGNAVPIGGIIVGFGSDGLIGAFNDVPGILSYTLFFGLAPGPTGNTNIDLLPKQKASFQTFNVNIDVTET